MYVARKDMEEAVIAVHASLYRYWCRRGYRHEEAMDLAQAGITAALEKSEKWRGESSLRTFMTIVGKRAGLNYLRKEMREERKKKTALEILQRRKRI